MYITIFKKPLFIPNNFNKKLDFCQIENNRSAGSTRITRRNKAGEKFGGKFEFDGAYLQINLLFITFKCIFIFVLQI